MRFDRTELDDILVDAIASRREAARERRKRKARLA